MGNRSNICIIGDQTGRETEKDAEEIHKGTIAKNFLNIIKDFKPPKKKNYTPNEEKHKGIDS